MSKTEYKIYQQTPDKIGYPIGSADNFEDAEKRFNYFVGEGKPVYVVKITKECVLSNLAKRESDNASA